MANTINVSFNYRFCRSKNKCRKNKLLININIPPINDKTNGKKGLSPSFKKD